MQTVHLQIRQYSCDECDKKFTQKSVLDTHARIHTGTLLYCTLCCLKSFKIQMRLLSVDQFLSLFI